MLYLVLMERVWKSYMNLQIVSNGSGMDKSKVKSKVKSAVKSKRKNLSMLAYGWWRDLVNHVWKRGMNVFTSI